MLPNQKFFEPNEKFFQFFEQFKGKMIYDVGAGLGHVTKALNEQGYLPKVEALDIYNRMGQDKSVLRADATFYDYKRNSVVMLCRPCHGDFVSAVITKAVDRKVSKIIYIGKESNLEYDLWVYLPYFKKVFENVGEENECVWLMEINDIPTRNPTM